MEQPEYTCPNCGEHRFEVEIKQYADVQFYDDGDNEVTDGPRGDLEWSDASEAICGDCCGWSGKLGEAKTKEQ